jgi:glycosyltransferase involved in cell wall biosynthesis
VAPSGTHFVERRFMARILYLLPGPVPPREVEHDNPVFYLSERHEGDVIQSVWGKHGNRRYRTEAGKFRFHFTWSYKPAVLRGPRYILFAIFKGLWMHYIRRRKYDVIITYGTNRTGLAALALKWLTRAKLIAEIPGTPATAFLSDRAKTSRSDLLKHHVSCVLARLVLRGCNCVRLVYSWQLDGFYSTNGKPVVAFHDMAVVSSLKPTGIDEKYVLLVGGPWYLKGADILIKAFQQIARQFPDHHLKIAGFGPDREFFDNLRMAEDRIEIISPAPHPLVLQLISACSVFVLPSRTEGLSRVLLEAMAFRKPIIASRVGGTPACIADGHNGLLFESNNAEDLAEKLKRVLSDQKLAATLARNGYETVHECFSEAKYSEHFDAMIDTVLCKTRTA